MRDLTKEEQDVLNCLAFAWESFTDLPIVHRSDAPEMQTAIHAAQNIVLARPATEVQMTLGLLGDKAETARDTP